MYLVIDSIEWEDIKHALIWDTPLKERRAVAQAIDPFAFLTLCNDCTQGKLPNEKMLWGLFKGDKLAHIVFDEDTADRFLESFKGYTKRQVRVGWK